jgi:hypothetical protein
VYVVENLFLSVKWVKESEDDTYFISSQASTLVAATAKNMKISLILVTVTMQVTKYTISYALRILTRY